jgi:hypothetical protein
MKIESGGFLLMLQTSPPNAQLIPHPLPQGRNFPSKKIIDTLYHANVVKATLECQ